MNILELIIDEEAEMYGIDAISLVEQPAIESDWVALKNQQLQFKTQDEEKRLIMGAALIPDKPIYRKTGEEEYYVYFSKKTVRRAMELYFKNGNQANATLEHEHKINGSAPRGELDRRRRARQVADVWPRCTRRNLDGFDEGRERRDMGEVR